MRSPHFFCGGPPKSGTTFIQRILDLHPDIGCSSEDNLYLLFDNFIKLDEIYNKYLLDVGRRIGANNVPPVESKVFQNAFFNLISDISLNRNHNKKFVGISDNTFLLNNLIPIFNFYLDSRIIIIFRNPIDTALSAWDHNHLLFHNENNPKHLEIMKIDGKLDLDKYVIKRTESWCQIVQNTLKKIETDPQRSLVITYESLSRNKKTTIIKVLKFLGCFYNDEIVTEMVNGSSIDSIKKTSPNPKFFSKGRLNFGKDELKPETIESSICIAKDYLDLLNIKFN